MVNRVTLVAILTATVVSVASLQAQTVQLVNAFPKLTFHQPVFLTNSGDGTDRLFVVQQDGFIKVFANDSNTTSSTTFLNISRKLSASDGEEGLLGLAFDPQFQQNGYFYIDYTAPNPLHTVVSRFHVSALNPNKADSLSEFTILTVNQPFTNHNAGMIAFGPDSDLYIAFGDGGSGGDPFNNGQNCTQLLGKILRIDVRDTTDTTHYRIPPDNPFAANTAGNRKEIWAYGLRNPFRFSFDQATGMLWAGDVGQDTREEIDIITRGGNYGWRIMEGTACYNPPSGCDTTGLTLPVIDYTHDLGNAVIGGYVYRGSRRPDLRGDYIYGDDGSGRIWMLQYAAGKVVASAEMLHSPYNISAFGVDEHNEMYVVSYSTSTNTSLYRFVRSPLAVNAPPGSTTVPVGTVLRQNFPNPFNPMTTIAFHLALASRVTVRVYDNLGREVDRLLDGVRDAGDLELRWDASRFASGVYMCQLESVALSTGEKVVRTMEMNFLK